MSERPRERGHRFLRVAVDGARAGLTTALWLLAIMLPVSLLVAILRWLGAIDAIGRLLGPIFGWLDLPGSSALVFVSSLFINLYSGIAVMSELALSMREVTILAIVGLLAHNFLVEIPVLSRTGSRPGRMIILRLAAALVAGFAVSRLLPEALDSIPAEFSLGARSPSAAGASAAAEAAAGVRGLAPFWPVIREWAVGSSLLTARIALILLGLMTGERLLNEFGLVRWLGRKLGFLMKFFGLPEEAAFLWVICNTLGLAYGAGVLRREVESGSLSRGAGDLLNHHIALSHSLLEDTLLYVALGVNALWITVPRLLLALAAVWGRRAELSLARRREAAGRRDCPR